MGAGAPQEDEEESAESAAARIDALHDAMARQRAELRNRVVEQMTAERVEWMLHSGIREASERVSSKSNLWADLISREGGWGPFCLQVAALGYHLRELQPPAEWRSISQFSTE